jgi:hypothetical protein
MANRDRRVGGDRNRRHNEAMTTAQEKSGDRHRQVVTNRNTSRLMANANRSQLPTRACAEISNRHKNTRHIREIWEKDGRIGHNVLLGHECHTSPFPSIIYILGENMNLLEKHESAETICNAKNYAKAFIFWGLTFGFS